MRTPNPVLKKLGLTENARRHPRVEQPEKEKDKEHTMVRRNLGIFARVGYTIVQVR